MAKLNIRSIAKWAALKGARHLGINGFMRHRLRGRLLVLCYHSVVPDDLPREPFRMRNAIRLRDFRHQMAAVERLMTPVSADDVLCHIQATRVLPPNAILVTFDDGFRNNLSYAAPEMQRLGIPSLIHLAVRHVGRQELLWTQELDERIAGWKRDFMPMPAGEPDTAVPEAGAMRWRLADRIRAICKRLPNEQRLDYLASLRQEPLELNEVWQRELYSFLSWDEVRQLAEHDVVLGSHTLTHPILSTLSAESLVKELQESKCRIEKELSQPCPWLAYPNGGTDDVSPSVLHAAAEAGYQVAFTLMGGVNPEYLQPLAVDRVCVPTELSPDAFEARLNGILALNT